MRNRQLKTDLNLRPIYHQTDEQQSTSIPLELLTYWVVNNIQLQLKEGDQALLERNPRPNNVHPESGHHRSHQHAS